MKRLVSQVETDLAAGINWIRQARDAAQFSRAEIQTRLNSLLNQAQRVQQEITQVYDDVSAGKLEP